MKRHWYAGLFEEPPSLLSNLHPLLVNLSVAPFVQQAAPDPENSMGFGQNGAPVGGQIEESSDHDGIEAAAGKRQMRCLRRVS